MWATITLIIVFAINLCATICIRIGLCRVEQKLDVKKDYEDIKEKLNIIIRCKDHFSRDAFHNVVEDKG